MDFDAIHPGGSTAGPYSPAIKVGNIIYISGQVPKDPKTQTITADDIKGQTRATLENIKNILNVAGSSISKIIKTTVFLKNIIDFSNMNQEYEKFFRENGVTEKFPARTTVGVAALPLKQILIEIDCIAVL